MLFGTRVGFSGTPADLLPDEFGACEWAEGDDAKMLHVLTDPAVVSYQLLPLAWDARAILSLVATAEPPLHALIDSGALVTGFSNLQAAAYLLSAGLAAFAAVVYLDGAGRKMVLQRDGMTVLGLERCGVAAEKRFTFFDHVHATGTDIAQAPRAAASPTPLAPPLASTAAGR